jgi:hypothetical protein
MTRDELNGILRDSAVEVMRDTPLRDQAVVAEALKRLGEIVLDRLDRREATEVTK